MSRKRLKYACLGLAGGAAVFVIATLISLNPITQTFDKITADSQNIPVTDRNGAPLSITYQSRWNTVDHRALYEMPELLTKSFLFSEDRKFYGHGGIDWKARLSAAYQNAAHGKTIRGASTITEQVVRLINPRPRTLWSKWLEGIEATLLESHANKASIFEFYLNQLPYAANRRGVVQAARYYFDRDLSTLSPREIMALVVLARAPSAYDLYRNPSTIDEPLQRLADGMKAQSLLSNELYGDIEQSGLPTQKPALPVDARHFARFVRLHNNDRSLHTTLDSRLQQQVQALLDQRLKRLSEKHVRNGAALVVDHVTGEVLAWVVAGATSDTAPAREIDAVTVPRQPGSTLKPFLYAAALEKGWTAATILNDAPLAEAVGSGLHRFRNYSNSHYGPITIREALGNSLNIPAILTINHIGADQFLSLLHKMHFDSLDRGSDVYDEGLALGNGEVTLYELVQGYTTLANHGVFRPLKTTSADRHAVMNERIFSDETASLIANILSDPKARSLEFGRDSILNLPVQTAAKTGTSTDYRDAWSIGFNDRYTVGLWMGNLDRTPMNDVTGSTGPALVLRSIFQLLNKNRETEGLYLSPALIEKTICTRPTRNGDCPTRTEFFVAGTENMPDMQTSTAPSQSLELVRPTEGLMMAYDPRLPASRQKFRFELAGFDEGNEVEWTLDGKSLAMTDTPRYLWPLEKGSHTLSVTVYKKGEEAHRIPPVKFIVK